MNRIYPMYTPVNGRSLLSEYNMRPSKISTTPLLWKALIVYGGNLKLGNLLGIFLAGIVFAHGMPVLDSTSFSPMSATCPLPI